MQSLEIDFGHELNLLILFFENCVQNFIFCQTVPT